MTWYIKEVVPRIEAIAGAEAATLIIVGKNWDRKGLPSSPLVKLAGYVTDSQLKQYVWPGMVVACPYAL